jgi:ribosomal protein S18 acetylase RimI-like enzyme
MVRIRPYTLADLAGLLRIQRDCFPPPFPPELWWQSGQIASHVQRFPAGALCAELEGELVGSATALILRWAPGDPPHTWSQASDDGWLRNHDAGGDTLYGVDLAVRPAWRGLRRFLAGSRLAGYRPHRERLTAEQYAAAVVRGELADPVVTPQLRAGLRPVQVVPGYLPDEESCDHALLMEWTP